MIRKNYLPAKSLDLILIPQSEDQIKKNGLPALILALSACLARAEDQRAPWEGGISSDRASNTTCTVTVHKLRQPWTPPDTHMHTHAHTHTRHLASSPNRYVPSVDHFSNMMLYRVITVLDQNEVESLVPNPGSATGWLCETLPFSLDLGFSTHNNKTYN